MDRPKNKRAGTLGHLKLLQGSQPKWFFNFSTVLVRGGKWQNTHHGYIQNIQSHVMKNVKWMNWHWQLEMTFQHFHWRTIGQMPYSIDKKFVLMMYLWVPGSISMTCNMFIHRNCKHFYFQPMIKDRRST